MMRGKTEDLIGEWLLLPFGLAHFEAAIAFDARWKLRVGELVPVSARGNFRGFIK